MNPTLRNILAFIAGLIVGSLVNMALIRIGMSVVPPPPGADMNTAEGIAAAMLLMETKHFIFPFLAHALGTLVGAWIAARFAATHKMKFAMGIGIMFLIGGISMVLQVPSPTWFTAVDLVLAYLPMAYLGGKLAVK